MTGRTNPPVVKVKFLHEADPVSGVPSLPTYMTEHAAGADVAAAVSQPVVLPPGGRALIPTGMALEIPPGYEIQVRPRSGLALKHGVILPNAPGTIDADYRGELGVILMNLGSEPFTVRPGDRIAQLVMARVVQAKFEKAEDLSSTSRESGGFGHTGR